jgi:hypothetical protein
MRLYPHVAELLQAQDWLPGAGVGPRAAVKPPLSARLGDGRSKKLYLAMLEDLSPAVLAVVLGPHGWRSATLQEASTLAEGVDLIVVDGKYNWDKRLYPLHCGLKGRLNANILTNKIELHILLLKYSPDLVAETQVLQGSGVPHFPEDGIPWIWRPEGGWQGKGVVVTTCQADLERVWRAHDHARYRSLLSRYITDPLLTSEGRKFHLRIYFLVVAKPSGKRSAVYRTGEIIHATDPYVAGDYGNELVHDTHRRRSKPCFFPDDYPGDAAAADGFFREVVRTLTHVSELALPQVTWYDEARGGFEIFGCDFMVDRAGRVYLLEINFKPRFAHPNGSQERLDRLSRFLFEGLLEFALTEPPPEALKQLVRCS